MNSNNQQYPQKKLWFRAKRYGLGWTPMSWEGWLCIAAYAAVMIADVQWYTVAMNANPLDSQNITAIFVAILILAIAALIGISYKKGEKPRWRWGEDQKGDGR